MKSSSGSSKAMVSKFVTRHMRMITECLLNNETDTITHLSLYVSKLLFHLNIVSIHTYTLLQSIFPLVEGAERINF